MPAPSKYQYKPIVPGYYRVMIGAPPRRTVIAIVQKDEGWWFATNKKDPDARGFGKTRDQAVDSLLEQIGGLGD
jgi:hypothetical protein